MCSRRVKWGIIAVGRSRCIHASASTLPSSVQQYVTKFGARAAAVCGAAPIALAAAGLLGWMLLVCTIDRFLQIDRGVRFIANLVCGISVMVLFLVRPIVRLFWRGFDWVNAAMDTLNSDMRPHSVAVGYRYFAVTGEAGISRF